MVVAREGRQEKGIISEMDGVRVVVVQCACSCFGLLLLQAFVNRVKLDFGHFSEDRADSIRIWNQRWLID
ncbi:hypothetical protein L1987_05977 [Smallanthus sonchifolius]|uniref:Uncharacterized protein n=1 Tax=Smallanthus sonchifolius TaxID=185202 RepID=A0ACB9JWU1_9ASTR|nr:hypothetical protein L1987_05977 [Smallanthus sonchifolius]